ncbi:hypothetical protein B5M09_005301 [Aphanomyces astaci]|uniref:GPN-loop GTPase 3 n=1 Tax=Aphanomyces astaci TaxID=112090 RepID=A0A3R7X2U9_APHAT|nr:hypothetical protein B5M09_005301 [Aphanomyces astaci]
MKVRSRFHQHHHLEAATNNQSIAMRSCQIVMGPAGTGKSTYCKNMHEFCAASGRLTYVVNLDPAADHFEYPVAFGVYLIQNLDWLQDLLLEYSDDDYFIFDCPVPGPVLGINDYSMVAFVPMNIQDEESIEMVLHHIDHAINYGEDIEPKVSQIHPLSQEPWTRWCLRHFIIAGTQGRKLGRLNRIHVILIKQN